MIQLARFFSRALIVNGPGERAVVWVQGCPLRCPGCFNQSFLEFGDQPHVRAVSADEVVAMVLQEHARQPLEGVTFSGGEPMAQADELALVARRLRQEGLNVVVFTGYTYQHLQSCGTPQMQRLLAETDLLVAGPFVQRLKNWRSDLRGSTNQELIYLSDRIDRPETPGPQVELQVADDGSVHMTGLPSQALRTRVSELLEVEHPITASQAPGDPESGVVSVQGEGAT